MSKNQVWEQCIETVTPAIAEAWLAKHGNPKNRPVDVYKGRVPAYAREMSRGEWMLSPLSPLGFDSSGMLLNGHHRLRAIIESGVTCKFVVFRNVPREVLRITDTEKARTTGQIGRMFDEDTSLDAAYKVVVVVRSNSRQDWLSPSDLTSMRQQFAGVAAEYGHLLNGIKVAGRKLRAGVVAGFLILLLDPKTRVSAGALLEDLACAADRTIVGESATRNLIKWAEGASGKHARLAEEGVCAVLAAHRQFVAKEDRAFIQLHLSNLVPYRVESIAEAIQ